MEAPAPPARRRLRLAFGLVSARGRRASNQDYAAFCLGPPGGPRGVAAAVADGLGGHKGGREAAETAVRAFIDGYYGASPVLTPLQAASRALDAVNDWIAAVGRRDPSLAHMATTFTALLLIGRSAHVLHVGDSRAYKFSEERLEQLTIDHVADAGEPALRLRRAIGLEPALRVDHLEIDLAPQDRLLLCTDGLHGALAPARLAQILGEGGAPQEAAKRLKEAALAAGSADNVTALVADVLETPPAEWDELARRFADAPTAPPPAVGGTLDGLRLEAVIAETPRHRVFRARDLADGKLWALKHPLAGGDPATRRASLLDAVWASTRAVHPALAEVSLPPPGRQSRLYAFMPYYPGETLAERARRRPPVALAEGATILLPLARAIAHLHRRGFLHGAVSPEHVILTPDGPRLIGLTRTPARGMAPEIALGALATEKSDLYALGATAFFLFAGVAPTRERRQIAAFRPDLPSWLGALLSSALADAPEQRPEDAFEFAWELERGLRGRARPPAPRRPLIERNPTLLWRILSLALFVALVAALAWRR